MTIWILEFTSRRGLRIVHDKFSCGQIFRLTFDISKNCALLNKRERKVTYNVKADIETMDYYIYLWHICAISVKSKKLAEQVYAYGHAQCKPEKASDLKENQLRYVELKNSCKWMKMGWTRNCFGEPTKIKSWVQVFQLGQGDEVDLGVKAWRIMIAMKLWKKKSRYLLINLRR